MYKKTTKKASLGLLECQKHIRDLSDNLPVLVWMNDVKFDYIYLNSKFVELTGFKKNNINFTQLCEMVHPDDCKIFSKEFKRCFKLKSDINIEYRIRKSDGDYCWIVNKATPQYDEQKNFLGYLGTCTDITKQKELEQFANDAQRIAHLGARVWRFADNTEIWSDELFRILGLTPNEIKPTHDDYLSFIFPDDVAGVIAGVNDAITERKPLKLCYRIKRKNGEIRYVQSFGEIKYSNSLPVSLHSSIYDITELKKVDELKNEFISTVSHELRTPLTSIKGSLSLILNGKFGEINNSIEKLVQIAHRNCTQLIRIINDILDIDKIESGRMEFKFEYTNISELIKHAVAFNQGFAVQYNVTLKTSVHEELSNFVDPDRIYQVLTNLISNAIKFSPPGGEVLVFTKKLNNKLYIGVKDKGPGIPNSFKKRIFNKFEQAESSDARKKGGTGLGLFICKAIIEKHNGTIGYIARKDVGTTFYCDIPFFTSKAPC